MSQTPSNFGEASVVFTGNTAPLEAATAKAVETTTQGAQKIEQNVTVANEKVSDSHEQAAESGLKQGREMLSLVGTAGALLAAFDKLTTGIQAAKQAGELLAAEFDKINSASGGGLGDKAGGIAGTIDATNAALDRQRDSIGRAMDDWGSLRSIFEKVIDEATGGSVRDAQRLQLEQIENTRKSITEQALALEDSREQEAINEAADKSRLENRTRAFGGLLDLQKQLNSAQESGLSPQEKITRDLERRLDTIDSLRGAVNEPGFTNELDSLSGRFQKIAEDAGKKLADTAAKELEKQIGGVLSRVRDQAASLFTGDQVTAQLERVASLLEDIADQRSAMRGRD